MNQKLFIYDVCLSTNYSCYIFDLVIFKKKMLTCFGFNLYIFALFEFVLFDWKIVTLLFLLYIHV